VKDCGLLVAEALSRDGWEKLGAIVEGSQAATYEAQRFTSTVLGHAVQGAVYRSSEPQDRAEKSVRRRQARALKEAQAEAKRLSQVDYGCEADAEQARQRFATTWEDDLLRVEGVVERRKVDGSYPKRGRPAAGVERPVVERIELRLAVTADEERAQQAIRDESCFVLVHLGKEKHSARELLEVYKGQAVVETRFPFLKDPSWADRFFVKRAERVEALGYVLLISLLLWTVWERRVRSGLDASGEGPIRDVTGMKKSRPTAMVCAHILHGLKVARVVEGGEVGPWQRVGRLTLEQERVIRFTLHRN
jgi:transposase